MASIFFSPIPTLTNPSISSPKPTPLSSSSPIRTTKHHHRRLSAAEPGRDPLGEFGARDPFPAELASNFGDKVLGNKDTEHLIMIPNLSALSLARRNCEPVGAFQAPLTDAEAGKLLKKVVGWRLVDCDGGKRLHCLWKVRDYGSGVELISRIYRATEAAGHYPNLHLEQPNQVRAELWTPSIGGLSLNDFILAAKIDEIRTLDLLPKKRVWA